MATLFNNPYIRALDTSGLLIAGAKYNFYDSGTSTPRNTYSDSSLSTANANPVVASNGLLGAIYLDDSLYKLVVTDADDNTLLTIDPINPPGSSQVSLISKTDVASIATSQNDWDHTDRTSSGMFLIESSAAVNITGIDSTDISGTAKVLYYINEGSNNITFTDQDASSSAANRFDFGGYNRIITPGSGIILTYNSTSNRWQMVAQGEAKHLMNAVASTEYTIASGVITPLIPSFTVDTQSDASTDDLDTITATAFKSGDVIALHPANTARTVVLKHGTGNIRTKSGNDISMDSTDHAYLLRYNGTNWNVISVDNAFHKGHIEGLIPSNGTDADHDIDITAGSARDFADNIDMVLSSAITKQLDASWAAGDDAGGLSSSLTIANATDYFIHLIIVAGAVDVGFDTSITAANLVTDHSATAYRPIGWMRTDGSANILAFEAIESSGGGLKYQWSTPILSIDLSNTLTTTARTDVLDVPIGWKVTAHLNVYLQDASAGHQNYLSDPDTTDLAPSLTAAPLSTFNGPTGIVALGQVEIITNTSGQIRGRSTLATVDIYRVATLGWEYSRR